MPAHSYPPAWSLLATIDGVDNTSLLTGRVTVQRPVNGAATASFALLPEAGSLDTQALGKKPVAISLLEMDSGGNVTATRAVYNGWVDTVGRAFDDGTLPIRCTDRFQETINAMDNAAIDAVIPGEDGTHLYSLPETPYEYSQQRLRSAPGDIFCDINGALVYASWQAAATADVEYGADDIVDGSLSTERDAQNAVVNRVDVTLAHTFQDGWLREWDLAWSYETAWEAAIVEYGYHPTIPAREMLDGALDNMPHGEISYVPLPTPRTYLTTTGLNYNWAFVDDAQIYFFGFTCTVQQNWVQRSALTYQFTVKAQASIDALGEATQSMQFAMESDEAELHWETSDFMAVPVGAVQVFHDASRTDYVLPLYSGEATQAALDAAGRCALAEAKVAILASHRNTLVRLSTLFDYRVSLASTARVVVDEGTYKGRVSEVGHSFDIDTGEALTSVSFNIYLPNVAGQSDDALDIADGYAAPVPDAVTAPTLGTQLGYAADPPLVDDPDFDGYTGDMPSFILSSASAGTLVSIDNAVFRPRFQITLPDVPSTNRDEREITATATYNVAIPQDEFTEVAL